MPSKTLFIFVLAFPAALMLACNASDDAAESQPPKTEAATPAVSPTPEERDAFIGQMESQLRTMEAKADDLRARVETLQGEAKTAAEANITALEEKGMKAREKLDALKSAGADAWDDAKMDLQAALLRLNQTLQATATALK